MKNMTLMLLLLALSFNVMADTTTTEETTENSTVTVSDNSINPQAVATPVSMDDEVPSSISDSADLPVEETTDTSTSEDEEW